MGGMDTVGIAVGDAIMQRVSHELQNEIGADRASRLVSNVPVDVGDAGTPWWNPQVFHTNYVN
jgi:hypothetical protein